MKRTIISKIILSTAILLCGATAHAQIGNGAYSSFSPYSVYAFGDLAQPGTAYNATMGGVGIASRNNRFINIVNPAAITARDSLSFMVDVALAQRNQIYKQGSATSANNTFTVNSCLMTFPIWKSLTCLVGILPFSASGYGYYNYPDDPQISKIGTYGYAATGQGSLYQITAALGYTFFKRLSLGVQYIHYFGRIESGNAIVFTDVSYQGDSNSKTFKVKGDALKFGLQYEQPLGHKNYISVGLTYRMPTAVCGSYQQIDIADTTTTQIAKARFVSEIGAGVAVNLHEQLRFEFNFTHSDWTKSKIEESVLNTGVGFKPAVSNAFRIGAEYIPNRNDIRYYHKRIAYRVGAYTRSEYYTLNDHRIQTTAVTLGATLPIFRWSNGATVGLEVGQRGKKTDNMIKEWFFNISLGLNLYDIWFQKYRYE